MKGARKGFKTGMGARRRLLRGLPREAVRELERAAQAPLWERRETHVGPMSDLIPGGRCRDRCVCQ